MISTPPASAPRCLAVGTAATLAYAGLSAWLLPSAAVAAPTFDAALVRLCAVVALVAAGWLWLATALTALAAVRGRVAHTRGVPAPVRRLVLAACGVALTSALVVGGPAHATPGHPREDRVATPEVTLSGLPLPDRATARAPDPRVLVAPGDTLWAIAARDLGPGASAADIDAAWQRIYALNRAEIGPDPDLIRPAQRLEVLP